MFHVDIFLCSDVCNIDSVCYNATTSEILWSLVFCDNASTFLSSCVGFAKYRTIYYKLYSTLI